MRSGDVDAMPWSDVTMKLMSCPQGSARSLLYRLHISESSSSTALRVCFDAGPYECPLWSGSLKYIITSCGRTLSGSVSRRSASSSRSGKVSRGFFA